MRKPLTFNDVLDAVKEENSRRVIERAVTANAMAKYARSVSARLRAYRIKTQALEHGIRAFPDEYALASIEHGGRLFGVRFRRRCALHVRAVDLGMQTHAWLREERAKIELAAAILRESRPSRHSSFASHRRKRSEAA